MRVEGARPGWVFPPELYHFLVWSRSLLRRRPGGLLTCAAYLLSCTSCLTCQKQSPVMKDIYIPWDGGGTARGLCTQASHRAKLSDNPSHGERCAWKCGSCAFK